eukprot:TRINITY_DN50923_c0_g1_i1.p1 TRINITY_DN50923_c0_g1~~TRINITY_DN50923_c0_g1_i1.p1  ORF type:complete len:778 (+),score=188.32 TRINITY_DN50923_c0_g1_i1:161-2335(+)
MTTHYKEFSDFCLGQGLGSYIDVFFERGVRLHSFHRLTKQELARMRITNSALVKRCIRAAQVAPRPGRARRQKADAPPPAQTDMLPQTGLEAAAAAEAAAAREGLAPSPPAVSSAAAPGPDTANAGVDKLATARSEQLQSTAATLRTAVSQPRPQGAGSPRPQRPVVTASRGAATSPRPGSPSGATAVEPPAGTVLHPTANQCVRNAMVYVPPSSAKRERILDCMRSMQYGVWATATSAGAPVEGIEAEHGHGGQAHHCSVCAELNVASSEIGDRLRAARREEYPFPRVCPHDPQYPVPEYDYAMQFRMLQLNLDACGMQHRMLEQEKEAREDLLDEMRAEEQALFAAQRHRLEVEEAEARRKLMAEQMEEWSETIEAHLGHGHALTQAGRAREWAFLQQEQCICLVNVEAYERGCIDAEEEADLLLLYEVSSHLTQLAARERRARKAELDALDYRSRCPTCWSRNCDFFRHPWRPWPSGRDELRPGARCSNQAGAGIQRKGSFFKGHMLPTKQNMRVLTGRCHGISIVSEYERLEMHAKHLPAVTAAKAQRLKAQGNSQRLLRSSPSSPHWRSPASASPIGVLNESTIPPCSPLQAQADSPEAASPRPRPAAGRSQTPPPTRPVPAPPAGPPPAGKPRRPAPPAPAPRPAPPTRQRPASAGAPRRSATPPPPSQAGAEGSPAAARQGSSPPRRPRRAPHPASPEDSLGAPPETRGGRAHPDAV